jgi:flagellar biosynthesis chaperone FliJ
MRAKRLTNEERAAKKILDTVNDFTIDLDETGIYIVEIASGTLYNRFITVAESAIYQKENNVNPY